MVKYCHQSRGLTYVLVPESSSSKEQLEPTDNIINNTEITFKILIVILTVSFVKS